MDARQRSALPLRLEQARRRFCQWRKTRKAHARIPDVLWASAVRMAGRYGLSKTVNALGLNCQRLKRRLAASDEAANDQDVATRFIELPPFASDGRCECLVEFEGTDGAKMRVRLRGVASPDLEALGRSFWSRRP